MDRAPQRLNWKWMGACLCTARQQLGWSQTLVGRKIGVSQSTISRIEKGDGAGYPLDTYWALTQALGVSWQTLMEAALGSARAVPPSRPSPHEPHAVLLSLAYILLLW
jgi:transcriptional regulator with XRE-family HTH domain